MTITSNFSQKIYNLCSRIPKGKVSTYKYIADYLGISPRVVGQVLKNNPYSDKMVPCHRIIASNYFVGGFRGEWGEGEKIADKKNKLANEGIFFDPRGYLLKDLRDKVIFQSFHE